MLQLLHCQSFMSLFPRYLHRFSNLSGYSYDHSTNNENTLSSEVQAIYNKLTNVLSTFSCFFEASFGVGKYFINMTYALIGKETNDCQIGLKKKLIKRGFCAIHVSKFDGICRFIHSIIFSSKKLWAKIIHHLVLSWNIEVKNTSNYLSK